MTTPTAEFEKYCEDVASSGDQVPDDFFRKALEYIVATQGQVCEQFEICDHPACMSSCGSWLVAHNVLEIADLAGRPAPWHEGLFPL